MSSKFPPTSLRRWMEFTEESIEMRVKINRSLKKMMNRQLSGAFDRWYEMVEESKSLRRRMQKLVKRMMANQLAGAYFAW